MPYSLTNTYPVGLFKEGGGNNFGYYIYEDRNRRRPEKKSFRKKISLFQ